MENPFLVCMRSGTISGFGVNEIDDEFIQKAQELLILKNHLVPLIKTFG